MQRIYDSKQQKIVDFKPLEEGQIGMYVCGPTVQSAPHIGHLRSALAYDVIRRWLIASGNNVTFVRNVTDIDDKILDSAKLSAATDKPEQWWALAYRVEREFTAAYDAIGVMPPTYEPRATANITQMINIIETLISRGHAYRSADGSANVYFDTNSWPDYGSLTHQSLEQMEPAADGDVSGKKDARDFALWKAYKDDEPISAAWDSPWGKGRPGWHIECSAMAKSYLGATFDIHGGGLDLRFPHHENEQAQSKAAGDEFARFWMHNGLVNTGGKKMSKSLGNSLFAHDLLTQAKPIVLRYFLMSAHYRSVLEYSAESLAEAGASFARIESALSRLTESEAPNIKALLATAEAEDFFVEQLPQDFVRAMNDDFSVPEAFALVHETVTKLNTVLETGGEAELLQASEELLGMLNVLGLNPLAKHWQAAAADNAAVQETLAKLVEGLLAERAASRAAKDFARSDEIRDRLEKAGVALEDHASGTRWSVK